MDLRYAILFAVLAFMPLSIAVSADSIKGQGLDSALADIKCKDTFMNSVMDGIISVYPDSAGSLNAVSATLQSDEGKLQSYADASDVEGFKAYVHGTYDQDMRSATQAIESARKSYRDSMMMNRGNATRGSGRGNGTRGDMNGSDFKRPNMTDIRDQYNNLRGTYENCHAEAVKSHGQEKADWYVQYLDGAQNRSDALKAKGIDTSSLDSLISDARSRIVSPLQSGLSTANDSKGARGALSSYCLFNGCQNGTNDHFAARFESTKLGLILDKLKSSPKAANATAQIDAAGTDLSNAVSLLGKIGTSQGSASDYTTLWNAINDAALKIKQAMAAMRS